MIILIISCYFLMQTARGQLPECPPNMVWDPCPNLDAFYKSGNCSAFMARRGIWDLPPPLSPQLCKPQCVCHKDHYMKNGICVYSDYCCDGTNEEPKNCPAPCDGTCSQPKGNIGCSIECQGKTCVCKPGHVRRDNACVPLNLCECKNFEDWNPCRDNCDIDHTCFNEFSGSAPHCLSLPFGAPACYPSCQCSSPYVRINGSCTPRTECCDGIPNTVMDICYDNNCERSCDPTKDYCISNCFFIKCVCNAGFVRMSPFNPECIPESQCSCFQPNMERVSCPGPCERSCFPVKNCLKECQDKSTKCICEKGFVRDYLPPFQCILSTECTRRCNGRNEELVSCASSCPPTCDNRAPICGTGCSPGCACKTGFLRHNGQCISPSECPVKCKVANEEYLKCGPACAPTCTNQKPKCNPKCTPGCFCKKGYIRKSATDRRCIKLQDCLKK